MNTKLRNYLLAAGGFAILAALVALTDPPHATAGPGPASVIVVNTDGNPVPIKGTVGLTGTPSVNVANMPSVSFANTSATPLFVRDVDNAARHPFTLSCQAPVSTDSNNSCSITVPAGKEFVIETEALSTGADPSNTVLATAVFNGPQQVAYSTLQDIGFSQPNQSFFQSTSAVKLYADPGSTILCIGGTKGLNPVTDLQLTCRLSGYFVTLP